MLAPEAQMRSPATRQSDRANSQSNKQREGIKLPVVLQALRDEIRTLDRYMRNGWITQIEANARLAEWQISYPPGMYHFDELAMLRARGVI
jgi:hypothetical protein